MTRVWALLLFVGCAEVEPWTIGGQPASPDPPPVVAPNDLETGDDAGGAPANATAVDVRYGEGRLDPENGDSVDCFSATVAVAAGTAVGLYAYFPDSDETRTVVLEIHNGVGGVQHSVLTAAPGQAVTTATPADCSTAPCSFCIGSGDEASGAPAWTGDYSLLIYPEDAALEQNDLGLGADASIYRAAVDPGVVSGAARFEPRRGDVWDCYEFSVDFAAATAVTATISTSDTRALRGVHLEIGAGGVMDRGYLPFEAGSLERSVIAMGEGATISLCVGANDIYSSDNPPAEAEYSLVLSLSGP